MACFRRFGGTSFNMDLVRSVERLSMPGRASDKWRYALTFVDDKIEVVETSTEIELSSSIIVAVGYSLVTVMPGETGDDGKIEVTEEPIIAFQIGDAPDLHLMPITVAGGISEIDDSSAIKFPDGHLDDMATRTYKDMDDFRKTRS